MSNPYIPMEPLAWPQPDASHANQLLPIDKIRARIAVLEGIRSRYLAYQQDRVNEHDHHGAWDCAVNLSETESEIAGLRFAEKAIVGD